MIIRSSSQKIVKIIEPLDYDNNCFSEIAVFTQIGVNLE
jgi:hypothetical protein